MKINNSDSCLTFVAEFGANILAWPCCISCELIKLIDDDGKFDLLASFIWKNEINFTDLYKKKKRKQTLFEVAFLAVAFLVTF
jgi:hypothetical protein